MVDQDPETPVNPAYADTHDGGEYGPATTDMTGTDFDQVSPGSLPDDADFNEAGAGGSNTPEWDGEGGPSSVD